MATEAAVVTVQHPALVVPTNDPKVVAVRDRIAKLVQEISELELVSPAAKATAVNLLSAIAGAKAEAERARLSFVEPLKKYTTAVDKLFRETLAPIVTADQELRRKVLAYDTEVKRQLAEAAAREEAERLRANALLNQAEKAEAKGEGAIAEQLLDQAATADTNATAAAAVTATTAPPPKTYSTPFGAKATTRTVWDLEITNAAEIPREYLVLDETRVRDEIRRGVLRPGPGGEQPIAGLRIFEREALSVRA